MTGAELRVAGTEAVGPYTLLRVEAGRDRPRRARPVLHAPPAGARAAAADVAVPHAGRRAGLPDRPDRPRHAHALRARRRGSPARARPARQRLRPHGAAPADRRRRHRRGAVSVRRPGARHRARDPRLPHGAPRRGRRARSGRRGRRRARRYVTSLLPDEPGRRARVRPGADARGRRDSSRRRPSSRGRRRWPAATAPATAASSRSTAACSGSASPGPVLRAA